MTYALDRRQFLNLGTTALAAGALGSVSFAQKSATVPVTGKDKRLIVLEKFPAVLETPLKLLTAGDPTPVDRLFVRNNQQPEGTATTEPAPLKGWTIGLSGLVSKEVVFDAAELANMDQIEHEMVLQCSGNSRSLYSKASQTNGTQWGRGGMGNVRFAGVRLRDVLKAKGVDVKDTCRYVTVEGRDDPLPEKEDYEHSMPVDDVLDRSIFAIKLNGKPLPAIHGGPVRFITPGIYGTMQMKWVSRLRFETDETDNYNQIPRYRVPKTPIKPGEKIEYTFENSRHNWDMKVKTVVLSPAPDARLKAGRTTIEGVAFNDGKAKIETVLISLDQGQTWQRAKLDHPKSPYAWTRFSYQARLKPGRHSIWSRAVDALGRSQPLNGAVHWNPSGYEWNGVEKIDVVLG